MAKYDWMKSIAIDFAHFFTGYVREYVNDASDIPRRFSHGFRTGDFGPSPIPSDPHLLDRYNAARQKADDAQLKAAQALDAYLRAEDAAKKAKEEAEKETDAAKKAQKEADAKTARTAADKARTDANAASGDAKAASAEAESEKVRSAKQKAAFDNLFKSDYERAIESGTEKYGTKENAETAWRKQLFDRFSWLRPLANSSEFIGNNLPGIAKGLNSLGGIPYIGSILTKLAAHPFLSGAMGAIKITRDIIKDADRSNPANVQEQNIAAFTDKPDENVRTHLNQAGIADEKELLSTYAKRESELRTTERNGALYNKYAEAARYGLSMPANLAMMSVNEQYAWVGRFLKNASEGQRIGALQALGWSNAEGKAAVQIHDTSNGVFTGEFSPTKSALYDARVKELDRYREWQGSSDASELETFNKWVNIKGLLDPFTARRGEWSPRLDNNYRRYLGLKELPEKLVDDLLTARKLRSGAREIYLRDLPKTYGEDVVNAVAQLVPGLFPETSAGKAWKDRSGEWKRPKTDVDKSKPLNRTDKSEIDGTTIEAMPVTAKSADGKSYHSGASSFGQQNPFSLPEQTAKVLAMPQGQDGVGAYATGSTTKKTTRKGKNADGTTTTKSESVKETGEGSLGRESYRSERGDTTISASGSGDFEGGETPYMERDGVKYDKGTGAPIEPPVGWGRFYNRNPKKYEWMKRQNDAWKEYQRTKAAERDEDPSEKYAKLDVSNYEKTQRAADSAERYSREGYESKTSTTNNNQAKVEVVFQNPVFEVTAEDPEALVRNSVAAGAQKIEGHAEIAAGFQSMFVA